MEPVVALAVIMALGIGAQWLASRLSVPSILFLLLAGFLVGPITGWIDPDAALGSFLLPSVTLAVSLILFEGGLNLSVRELREVGSVVRNLVTVGALVTWLSIAVLVHFLFAVKWSGALLMGAMLVVSGPTVVGPLLATINPPQRLASMLKWESILIDPIGAALGLIVFEAILVGQSQESVGASALEFLWIMGAGAVTGMLFGRLLLRCLERFLISDELVNAVCVGFVLAAFGAGEALKSEAGLVATTVMGYTLANQRRVNIKHLVMFSESIRVILIGCLFVVLAARLPYADLFAYGPKRVLFLINLIFIVRPLAVLISTWRSDLTLKEKTFLAALAPRGIVAAATASVFGIRAHDAGIQGGEMLVSFVFMVIVSTCLVYSLASRPLARALGVVRPARRGTLVVGADPAVRRLALALQSDSHPVLVTDTDSGRLREAEEEGLTTMPLDLVGDDLKERVDAAGLRSMLVLSAEHEVNALVMHRMVDWFGQASIFRLAPPEGSAEPLGERVGRFLFLPGISHRMLRDLFHEGCELERVTAWDGFAYEPFVQGQSMLPLWIARSDGAVDYVTAEHPPQPDAGEIVVFLKTSISGLAEAPSPSPR